MNCILKYPGSKWKSANWIVDYFPKHKFYIEPFFGSGAVFFNKEQSMYETINDIDKNVINYFEVIRDYPDELSRKLYLTPFSRDEFLNIQELHSGEDLQLTDDKVENARRFAVRCFQSFGSKMSCRVGWKNTKMPNGPVNPKIWGQLPDLIKYTAVRLKNTQIENTNAINLIKNCNHSEILIYADPPYLLKTRKAGKCYKYEYTDNQHIELLNALLNHNGAVVVSGYDNEIYNSYLKGWQKFQKTVLANSAEKRIETIWLNYNPNIKLF